MRLYGHYHPGVPYVCDFNTTTFSQLPDDYWPGIRTCEGVQNITFVRNWGQGAPPMLAYNNTRASVYDTSHPDRQSYMSEPPTRGPYDLMRVISSACLTKRGILMLVDIGGGTRIIFNVGTKDSSIRCMLPAKFPISGTTNVHDSLPYSHTADYYDGSFACLTYSINYQTIIYRDAGERCETTPVDRGDASGAMVTYGPTAYIIDPGQVTMSDNRIDHYGFISKWDHLDPNIMTSRTQIYAKALSETTIAIAQMPVYDGSYWGRMCMYDIRVPDSPLCYPDIPIPPHIGGLTPTSWAFCPQK